MTCKWKKKYTYVVYVLPFCVLIEPQFFLRSTNLYRKKNVSIKIYFKVIFSWDLTEVGYNTLTQTNVSS